MNNNMTNNMNNNGINMMQDIAGMRGMGGMGMMPSIGQPNYNGMGGSGINLQQDISIDPTAGMSVYKPTGGGMLISELIKDDESIKSSRSNRTQMPRVQHQHMEGYGNGMQQGMQRGYYDPRMIGIGSMDPNYQYKQKGRKNSSNNSRGSNSSYGSLYSESVHSDSDSDYSSIRKLANDVNNSLQALEKMENNKKQRRSTDTPASDSDNDDDSDNDNEQYEHYESENKSRLVNCESETDYLKTLTEFLLLLTLYVIMSQPFVVSFTSSYIQQLNPTEEGTVNMSGIIIYGIIMIVLFMVVRRIVFSRM